MFLKVYFIKLSFQPLNHFVALLQTPVFLYLLGQTQYSSSSFTNAVYRGKITFLPLFNLPLFIYPEITLAHLFRPEHCTVRSHWEGYLQRPSDPFSSPSSARQGLLCCRQNWDSQFSVDTLHLTLLKRIFLDSHPLAR